MTLPTDAKARNSIPIYSGFIAYFPRAICAVAELSALANEQHNPDTPTHWDKSKSTDEKDALMRHLVDPLTNGGDLYDTDRVLHATKMAWRAMADLERLLDIGFSTLRPEIPAAADTPSPAQDANAWCGSRAGADIRGGALMYDETGIPWGTASSLQSPLKEPIAFCRDCGGRLNWRPEPGCLAEQLHHL